MTVTYTRSIAGEKFITTARFGPVGRDLGRRTVLVNLEGRRRAPIGKGRAKDEWQDGYPAGRLRASVHSEVVTRRGQLIGEISADARRPGETTSYAESVHEGSEAHVILPKRKRWLRWPGAGGDEFRRGVLHPGQRRGKPFLRDSLPAASG